MEENTRKTKYILFEGQDGVGKSKTVREVEKILKNDGFKCMIVEDAGFSDLGFQIRPLLDGRGIISEEETWFDLFIAMRRENISLVKEHCNDFDFILYDRSTPSTLVYNNIFGSYEKTYEEVQKRLKRSIDFDVIIYLHDTPSNILSRLLNRPMGKGKYDRYEIRDIVELGNKYNTAMTFLSEKGWPVYRVKTYTIERTVKDSVELIYGITRKNQERH